MQTLYSERTSYSVHTVTLSLEGENPAQPSRAHSFSGKTPFQFFGKLLMQNSFDSRHKEEFLRVEVVHEANQENVDLILHKYRFIVDRSHNFDFDGEATIFLLKPNEVCPEDCSTPPRKMTMNSSRNVNCDPSRPSTSVYQKCFPLKAVLAALRENFSYPNQKEEISNNSSPGNATSVSVRIELKLLFQLQFKYTYYEANDGAMYRPQPQISKLSALAVSLKNMLDNAIHSDVQLEVDTSVFPAHMAILSSQSEVFKVMFDSNMVEKKTKRVIIRDMSAGAVKEMLSFIYTRETFAFQSNIDMAIEMLHAAEKYIIADLRSASEKALQRMDLSKLAIDDILGLYMCSRQLKMPQVQINALNGLKAKGPFLGASKAFEKFCLEHPEIIPEFFTEFACL